MENNTFVLYPCKKKPSRIRILAEDVLTMLVLFFIMSLGIWLIFDVMARAVQ